MKKLMLLFIALVFTVSGCATSGIFGNPYAELTIKHSISRYLAQEQGKVESALQTIDDLKAYVGTAEGISVDALKEHAVNLIPWGKMHPADKMYAMDMVAIFTEDLKGVVGSGTLNLAGVEQVLEYLDWVESLFLIARLGG